MSDVLQAVREQRLRLAAARERDELPDSMAAFIRAAWPVLKPQERYQHNWHIEAICEKLAAVSAGEIKRLQIWLPPGMMKSFTVSVFWPAWEWTRNPWIRYWTASYQTGLAGRLCAMSRDLMQSPWFQERWGDGFTFTREADLYYANDKGGTRLATAPNSTGSGEHGHRIIIDDPINAKEADATSRAVLDAANEWYDGTVTTRGIGSDHARVIIMQRLHENDLAAHVMKKNDQWEVLCLPERYEASHPFVWPHDPRKEGDLLWPSYRDAAQSAEFAASLTSHRANGQLQQRPSAREGEIIMRSWWRFYDPRWRDDPSRFPRFGMLVVSADTPQKDKQTNDLVAVQGYGFRGADRYLLDLAKGHMNYNKAKRTIREMAQNLIRTFPGVPIRVLIENTGWGPELIIDLKPELPGVTKINPQQEGDKIIRAESASDSLESGNVYVPGFGPPWQAAFDEHQTPADVADFIDNCARFPNAEHDDDVDAWSQAMNWGRGRNTGGLRTTSSLVPTRTG